MKIDEEDLQRYDYQHGLIGLRHVLLAALPREWEFEHPLDGWVPYAVWGELSIKLVRTNSVRFRRLREVKVAT
jgi:hypothetical protein